MGCFVSFVEVKARFLHDIVSIAGANVAHRPNVWSECFVEFAVVGSLFLVVFPRRKARFGVTCQGRA